MTSCNIGIRRLVFTVCTATAVLTAAFCTVVCHLARPILLEQGGAEYAGLAVKSASAMDQQLRAYSGLLERISSQTAELWGSQPAGEPDPEPLRAWLDTQLAGENAELPFRAFRFTAPDGTEVRAGEELFWNTESRPADAGFSSLWLEKGKNVLQYTVPVRLNVEEAPEEEGTRETEEPVPEMEGTLEAVWDVGYLLDFRESPSWSMLFDAAGNPIGLTASYDGPRLADAVKAGETPRRQTDGKGRAWYLFAAPVEMTGWQVAFAAEAAELDTPFYLLLGGCAAFILLCTALTGMAAYLSAKGTYGQLARLCDMARQFRQGRLGPMEEEEGRYDGCEAVQLMNQALRLCKDQVEEVSAALSKMSRGDFGFSIHAEYAGDFAAIESGISEVSAALYSALSQIESTTRQVHGGSRLMADSSAGLAQGVAAQSRSIQALTRSIKALGDQVGKNIYRVSAARRSIEECGGTARIGERQLRLLLSAVQEMGRISEELAGLVGGMEELSTSAAILGVSASVESARAKDMGFAVVADEMQDLARQTDELHEKLEGLSERCVRAVDKGSRMAQRAADGLRGIAEKTQKAAASTNEICEAADEQNRAAQRAAQDVAAVASAVQNASLIAEQNNTSSKELAVRSQILSKLVSGFYAQGAVPPKPRRGDRES